MNRVNDPFHNLADALGEDLVAAPAEVLAAEAAREPGGSRGLAAGFDRIAARAARRARWRRIGQPLRAFLPSLAWLASWPSAMAAVASVAVLAIAGNIYLNVHVAAPPPVMASAPPSDAVSSARRAAAARPPLAFGEEQRRDADNAAVAPAAAPPPGPAAAPGTAPRPIRTARIADGFDTPAPPAPPATKPTPQSKAKSAPQSAPKFAVRPVAAAASEPMPFSEERDELWALTPARAAAGPPPQQLAAVPPQAPAGTMVDRTAADRDAVPSFAWPLRGRAMADLAAAKADKRHDGPGLDIAVPVGTPIHAAADGLVVYAGNEIKGFGNLVLVRHSGGFVTAYAHLDKILVKVNDSVKRGQLIARSGRTGTAAAPLLHFEIRKGSTRVDPGQYLPPPG